MIIVELILQHQSPQQYYITWWRIRVSIRVPLMIHLWQYLQYITYWLRDILRFSSGKENAQMSSGIEEVKELSPQSQMS